MKLKEKKKIIQNLVEKLKSTNHFYITDISGLNCNQTNNLRQECFKNNIKLQVIKNTLLKRALNECPGNYKDILDVLKGPSAIIFSEKANIPAKLIKNFRKKFDKPILKAAYVHETIYIGDNQLDELIKVKSKEELIADIIFLLKSPVNTLLGTIQAGNKIHAILESLSKSKK